MCKLNKKNRGRRIDSCMKQFIRNLNWFKSNQFKIISCCCGHGKYPMSIIFEGIGYYELISGKPISRRKKFYKYDKQSYPYIPEVLKEEK